MLPAVIGAQPAWHLFTLYLAGEDARDLADLTRDAEQLRGAYRVNRAINAPAKLEEDERAFARRRDRLLGGRVIATPTAAPGSPADDAQTAALLAAAAAIAAPAPSPVSPPAPTPVPTS